MPRNGKTITITLPSDLLQEVDQAAERDGVSRDAFLLETARRAVRDHKWREILKYGREQARRMGIKPEDVSRLIEEYREETAAAEPEAAKSTAAGT